MSSAGIPLWVIQEISGHRSLQVLQRYLEVSEVQLEGAIASLSFCKDNLWKPTDLNRRPSWSLISSHRNSSFSNFLDTLRS
jgi:hypothetical protein